MNRMIRNLFLSAGTMLLGSVVSAQATTLTANINVDNEYTMYISTDDSVAGTQFGYGNKWWMTYTNVSPHLTVGVTNYLHIQANDWRGIAGLLGEFILSDGLFAFENGTQSMLSLDAGLRVSETGWSNYGAVTDIGINSVSPWRNRNTNNPNAHWVWSDSPRNDNLVYFSAAINPVFIPQQLIGTDAQVPLPAGVLLLGSAIGGLVVARRKTQRAA